jgi:diguanylate cyclase (GGDEF)-like protein/PAS domain S-box-containing protein
MHYLGMLAVQFPGTLSWSYPYVAFSILFSVLPMIRALRLALTGGTVLSAIGAAALIACAILLLHFTSMAGLTVIPGGHLDEAALRLSPMAMGLTIGFTALVLLIMFFTAALISARARSAIAERQREFSMLVQSVKDCAITMLDREGRVSSWNLGAERLKGYRDKEVIGRPLACFYTAEDRAAGQPATLLARARRDGSYHGEGWLCRADGTRFWASVLLEALHDEAATFIGYAQITRDMTRFREDQERLAELTRNLDDALSNMKQGLCLFGADNRLLLANEQASTIIGVDDGLLRPGVAFEEIVRRAFEKREGGPVPRAMIDAAVQRHLACLKHPEGGSIMTPFVDGRVLLMSYSPKPDGGWVSTMEDITERRQAEQRIEYMALHDSLTGLANRIQYNERLVEALAAASRDRTRVAVVGIDLNHFKDINDTHGHDAGDAVLRKLAARLSAVMGEGEFIGRFGGDEFSAFKTFTREADLSPFTDRLETALTAPVALGEVTVTPGASLGVAVFPRDGQDPEQLARNADLAMYRAKGSLTSRTCFYEHGMDEAVRARRLLSNDLKGAEARGELSLAYQVQRSVLDQKVVGYEALLRWNHPSAGAIPPDRFIPIAEESGEIVRIGEWVLRTACSEAARWPQPWRVAVNLSPVQLMNVELVDLVAQVLLDTGLPARRLELEITETALIGDKARALHTLRQIKALGVSIAIDDFGTGYSSLDTLHSFPFDKIKIDKSFLIESARSPQARAIIRAVLALGRSLGLPVLAEGLESAEQLDLLRLEGCAEAQGYFFGKPAALASENGVGPGGETKAPEQAPLPDRSAPGGLRARP